MACLKERNDKTSKDKNEIIKINNDKTQENNFYSLNIIADYIIKDFYDKIKFVLFSK